MRKLSLAIACLLTWHARALVSPCSIPVTGPSEVFAIPNQVVMLSGQRPIGICGFQFTISTPDVLAIDPVMLTDTTFTVRVLTLAPGEGKVIVSGYLPGGNNYTRVASTIHVDTCEAGAHVLKLAALYNAAPGKRLHIEPEIEGSFYPLSFTWLVNGIPAASTTYFDFVPPSNGTFHVTLVARSGCGETTATTYVVANSRRSRGARH